MYKIRIKIVSPKMGTPGEDTPADDPFFFNEAQAWEEAVAMAKSEAETLTWIANGTKRYASKVSKQMHEASVVERWQSPVDNKWHDEVLTTYSVYELVTNAVEIFGFSACAADNNRNPDISTKAQVFPTKSEAETAAWKQYDKSYRSAWSYGLLPPSEARLEQSAFSKRLWGDGVVFHRTDKNIRYSGWTQVITFGG